MLFDFIESLKLFVAVIVVNDTELILKRKTFYCYSLAAVDGRC